MGIEEKPVIEYVESGSTNLGIEEKPADYHEQYHIDPKKERKLLRKLDLAILPMTVLMYLSAQLDVSTHNLPMTNQPAWKPRKRAAARTTG